MLNPKLSDTAAWQQEISRLPTADQSLALLQRLPRYDLEDLAQGLIAHIGEALRHQDMPAALDSLNTWYSTAQAMAARYPEIARYNDYINDLSQIGHLEKLITEAPPEAIITKRSLEYRLQQLKDQVAALDPVTTMPEPVARPEANTYDA